MGNEGIVGRGDFEGKTGPRGLYRACAREREREKEKSELEL